MRWGKQRTRLRFELEGKDPAVAEQSAELPDDVVGVLNDSVGGSRLKWSGTAEHLAQVRGQLGNRQAVLRNLTFQLLGIRLTGCRLFQVNQSPSFVGWWFFGCCQKI